MPKVTDTPIIPRPLAERLRGEPPERLANGHGGHEANGHAGHDPEPLAWSWGGWATEEAMDAAMLKAAERAEADMRKPPPEGDPNPQAADRVERLARLVLDSEFDAESDTITNYREERQPPDSKGKSRSVRVGLPLATIAGRVNQLTRGWPRRVGDMLFDVSVDRTPQWLAGVNELFAWLGGQLRQPPRWGDADDAATKAEFQAYLRQHARAYDAVEAFPHYPPMPRRCYLHVKPGGGDGRALDGLISRFRPATDADRALIRSLFLTLLWGGEPGSRPAFLVGSDDDDGEGGRGVGKTTMCKAAARLVGGHIDMRPTEDLGRMLNRLLTPGALTRRVALLDNVKTLRFSWADLEALITNDTINGYQLYVGDAVRPNTLTWLLTLNGASLSKDLAQRCVIVRLKRPDRSASWEEDLWRYIEENRWAVVGDILAALRSDKPQLARFSRWSAWEANVLAACPGAGAAQQAIAERQASVDGDQEEADLVRAEFAAELRRRKHTPETEVIFIPSADAARIVNEATGEQRPVQRATAYLLTLGIHELRKSNWKDGSRGWRWTGRQSEAGAVAVRLNSPWGKVEADPDDAPITAYLKAHERAKAKAEGRH